MNRTKVWQFVSITLFALVMGVFWGTWFSLTRTIESLPAEVFITVGHSMIENLAIPMAILMIAAIGTSIVVLFLLSRRSTAFWLSVAGVALMVVALLITLLVEVPIDNQIKRWTPMTYPTQWQELRDRWETFHALRAFVSIGAMGFLLAGALVAYPRDAVEREADEKPEQPPPPEQTEAPKPEQAEAPEPEQAQAEPSKPEQPEPPPDDSELPKV